MRFLTQGKTNWKYILIVIILATVAGGVILFSRYLWQKNEILKTQKQSQDAQKEISLPYDFPIKPGSEEWKEFQTHAEMIAACQIPPKILKNMTTPALIETVLNYPLYFDYGAYRGIPAVGVQGGFEEMSSSFNGFNELFTRQDAGTKMIEKYESVDPEDIGINWSLEKLGEYSFKLEGMEMFLAQPQIRSKLTEKERSKLFIELLDKNSKKNKHSDVYGISGQESIAFVLAKLMLDENVESFKQEVLRDEALSYFIKTGDSEKKDVLDKIFLETEKFLSQPSPKNQI